jgi:hypothetical protein
MGELYREHQVGSYCRKHSINNLIGREVITTAEFDTLCDEFDKHNEFTEMCSKNQHMYYNYGGAHNIFGYVLAKKGIDITITGYDNWRKDNIDLTTDREDLLGAFVFKNGHVWCIRYYKDKFYSIDSMGGTQHINENYFNNKQLCFLVVHRNIKFFYEK